MPSKRRRLQRRRPRKGRRLSQSLTRARFVTAAAATLAVGVAAVASPWPGAFLIRAVFDRGAADTLAEMRPYAPRTGIDTQNNLAYSDGGSSRFDWFSPAGNGTPLPTVVWIHGGAWLSGGRADVDPYMRLLAERGMTAISLDYPISPESTYPTALEQINLALEYLTRNAATYRIDPDKFVLAGDSAGAQLASQIAALTTNPGYADAIGIRPALRAPQLKGVVLNCGIFDLTDIPTTRGITGWGFKTALWAYLGTKRWPGSAESAQMSTLHHVTDAFPPTWISGGNGDALTAGQSKPFAATLEGLGVEVTPVFYSASHSPSLPHEYQFHLDLQDARAAFESTAAFIAHAAR